ncbi:hypothetical protein EN871_12780 [bacterium M00.F.Ca.ET.228.01.1.1]|uniref:hypothetical protein n=1 Tax=Paraburkholderia phenoliruptrix TaxID=252970 RepID=UPI0010922E94|nr:hypothetical protein EN871_12780 [bacterium M00.F.Ca.ET.228.01.1.1]TGS01566.1 hypothetical protein EN834_12775 [bacterium M00.F.Ca.ET.191.01.1.1]TGU08828.1 hypothetical protein EN798_06755 [bacterium M00.F.Ca.ET.155.01.1.1]
MVIFAFREFVMENAVYWNGRQVGIECDGRISWFSSAPSEAVAAYGNKRNTRNKQQAQAQQCGTTGDDVLAHNLSRVAHWQFEVTNFRG